MTTKKTTEKKETATEKRLAALEEALARLEKYLNLPGHILLGKK